MKIALQSFRNRLLVNLCCIATMAYGPSHSRGEAPLSISFRLAFDEAAPDTEKIQFESAPQDVVYVSKHSVLERKDLLAARVERRAVGRAVIVTLSSEGAKRVKQTTSSHLHARLAVVVNGVVISAPTILQPIEGKEISIISARLSEPEMEDLAKQINGAHVKH